MVIECQLGCQFRLGGQRASPIRMTTLQSVVAISEVGARLRKPSGGFRRKQSLSLTIANDGFWIETCRLRVAVWSTGYRPIRRETRDSPMSVIAGPFLPFFSRARSGRARRQRLRARGVLHGSVAVPVCRIRRPPRHRVVRPAIPGTVVDKRLVHRDLTASSGSGRGGRRGAGQKVTMFLITHATRAGLSGSDMRNDIRA